MLSPLNWGLGHVCRTVPVIQTLIAQGNEVIICCDESQEEFYRNYFPELWYVPHAGYPFRFKGKGKWTLDVLSSFSSLNHHLVEEKKRVEELVELFNPDLIISDQRFGFVSKNVKSVVISHQLNLPVPKWNFLAKLWNRKLLSAFVEIWVPDTLEQKYSGVLSNGKHKNKIFIGTTSRFSNDENIKPVSEKIHNEYLGIVSGPAPYNEQFLDLLLDKLKRIDQKSVIIVPPELFQNTKVSDNVSLISSPNHEAFIKLIQESKVIISRSGYSTLMDLVETGKKGILIPTPGQTEQLYLASLHCNHPKWTFKSEVEFAKMSL